MITVIATWINHPEVLKEHKDMWVKVFNDRVRYVAYIDAKNHSDFSNFGDASVREQLVKVCIDNDIDYVIVPQNYHMMRRSVFGDNCIFEADQNPSGRDSLVCQYAWNKEVLEGGCERIILVQSDIFPYRRMSWSDFTHGSQFYFKMQTRKNGFLKLDYAWEGLCAFDMGTWSDHMKRLVDFEYGLQKAVYTDTGGGLWKIMEALTDDKKYNWTGLDSLQWSSQDSVPELPFWVTEHLRKDPRNSVEADGTISYYSEIQDDRCFHLRAGGNWDNAGKEVHDKRYSNFLKLLKDAIVDGSVFLS
uniref:Uncharacterized protein n=1 Tax=viral metagenome TaxID=1070528 RepID=A0A6C0K346_9ZZZZ